LLLITTSRHTSPRVRSFVKDLVSVLPRSIRIQRGHKTLEDLAIEAYTRGLKYVLVVSEFRGNPGRLSLFEVQAEITPKLVKIADLILKGVKLSRENPLASKVYGASSIAIDHSKCISSDCFLLADILLKVFQPRIAKDPDVTVLLEEDKYIVVKFQNAHGKLIGPVLRVLRVIGGGGVETETGIQS
jgi:U3 small nucleolar ribonucleoprotein protein IMP4